VELIESRIGGLPAAVAGVVDVLAVGEPIELAALTRITDAAAVEDADTRGLITLNHASDGEEVWLGHPLYGEVRRKRAAATRLRRLRGLVATELASSARRDEIPMVVRRATLSLESDLKPDPHLLLQAAQGAVWLADMPLADRLWPRRPSGRGHRRRPGSFAVMHCRGWTAVKKPTRWSLASSTVS